MQSVDEYTSERVSIPVGWWLTDKDVATIIDVVIDYDRSCQPGFQNIETSSEEYQKIAK